MADIKFVLTLDETNLILESLGQMPFVRVHQLIAKIQEQARSQLTAMQDQASSPTTQATERSTEDNNER